MPKDAINQARVCGRSRARGSSSKGRSRVKGRRKGRGKRVEVAAGLPFRSSVRLFPNEQFGHNVAIISPPFLWLIPRGRYFDLKT